MTLLKTCIAIAAAGALLAAPPAGATRIYAGQPTSTAPWQMVLSVANNGKKVTGLTFHVYLRAPGGSSGSSDSGKTLVVSRLPSMYRFGQHYLVATLHGKKLSGHLRGFYSVGPSTAWRVDVVLTGTITTTGGTGLAKASFANVDVLTGQVTPDGAQTIHWKALRHPGTVYGGTTSQGEPIVVELQRSRKGVDHVHIAWYAVNAQDQSSISYANEQFDMVPFALTPSGTFDRHYSVSDPDGTAIDWHFAGKVGKVKASGTLSCDWTFPSDPPGGPAENYSSGQVSWSALTG